MTFSSNLHTVYLANSLNVCVFLSFVSQTKSLPGPAHNTLAYARGLKQVNIGAAEFCFHTHSAL